VTSKILVATRNRGKQREILSILSDLPYDIVFPDDLGISETPKEQGLETAETFEGNALLKAEYFLKRSGLPTAADDSGIEVMALGGIPGVRSRRFALAGPGEDEDLANNNELLKRLAGAPKEKRQARYRCSVVFLKGKGALPRMFEGECHGSIANEPSGSNGFGYDPLFISNELGLTFGEADPKDKDEISHRGRAFRKFAEWLEKHPI